MKVFGKNLLIVFKDRFFTEQEYENEATALHQLLHSTITDEKFCRVTELVDRNSITRNSRKIIKASGHFLQRPFRFLINKN
ncbi:MAG: hypothetical protein ACT4OJ_00740 [Bacteroidota bacterium]